MTVYRSPMGGPTLRDISITERVCEGLAHRPDDVVLSGGPTGPSATAGALPDGVRSRIVDPETGETLGPGEVGELLVRGASGDDRLHWRRFSCRTRGSRMPP